jgi:flagellar biosynthesis GTPase FlhF
MFYTLEDSNMVEIQKNNEIIESLINSLNSEIEKIGKLNSIPSHIIRKNLHLKIERLKKIQKVFQIEKYNIVFIGTIGAGKTTAICHLFNLIGEFQVTEKGKNFDKTFELLSTGSGRTTICEVIIKAGEKTYIEIDP